MTPKFLNAINFVLAHEGGFVDDKLDPGGRTNFGISQRAYPNINISALTKDGAKEIYFRDWWTRYGYEKISPDPIAIKLLDMAVLMGHTPAVGCLQRAINVWLDGPIDVDGVLGSQTVAAITTIDTINLYRTFCHFCATYYEALNKPRFIKGWLRRSME